MKRNILIASVIAIVLVSSSYLSTPSASALTADEIQAQIKELLAKVADLTRQLNILQGQSSSTTVQPSTSQYHRVCGMLARSLAQGAHGDDVLSLQEFLQSEGHFSVNATGYYGPATAQAVARWQASQGLSAVGVIGPMSRERIKLWCGGSWQNTERFSASPARGESPLTVTFSTWLSGFRPNTITYTIDFGDGASERAADCPAPADACTGPGHNTHTHTYTANGTYTATLNKITDPCPDDGDPNTPRCLAPIHSEVVAKVQVQVGPVACTKEYMPVCGSKPIVCITTPCNPIQQTYSNRCMMNADGATYLHEGQCRADTDPANDARCRSWYDGCNSCSRSTPGGPAMCTLRACTPETMTKPYCTAYFDSTANKQPVISSFSGPTTLTLNQQGTWKISASDPENGSLTYSILWGDEWYGPNAAGMTSPSYSVVQDTTFTHSYSHAGSYKISVTVRDDAGNEARTTTTVYVENAPVACTMEYSPVCGRPPGCANTCPPGMYCTLVCRLHDPVTYGNKCQLSAANAEYLYAGACNAQ